MHNPDNVLPFFTELLSARRRRRPIFIKLDEVTSLTLDAIAILLSILKRTRSDIAIGGNLPREPRLRSMIIDSGFLDHLEKGEGIETGRRSGAMHRRSGARVEPDTAQSLIRLVTEGLYGKEQRKKGVYSTLIEAMSNTYDHAYTAPDQSGWWATAYFDTSAGRAYFCFVDLGIGILKSTKLRPYQAAFRRLGLTSGATFLSSLLRGEIKSRTGLSYRGKGLPKIFRNAEQGKIENLTIVTNNVIAQVARDRYMELRSSFGGTLLYWEIQR